MAAIAAKSNGLSVPVFMQLNFKNSVKPGFSKDKETFRAAKEKHNGDRRVQDACDTQRTAFYSCLPDDTCNGCYELAIQAADDQSDLCLEYEALLCTGLTTCSCGCEPEAEILFQCLYEDVGCSAMINCTDTTCREEAIALSNCDATNYNISCFTCVGDAIDLLFPTEDSTAGCNEIEDAFCPALVPCGCGDCSTQVIDYRSCMYSKSCSAFDCNTTSCDVELAAFYGCLPDDTCKGCYQGAIQMSDQDSTLCL